MVLVCHVISQDHQVPIKVSYYPAKFGGHRHSDSGDIVVFVFHVILQDLVIKESCDFICRSSSRRVTLVPNLVAIGTLVVEI